MSTTALVRMLFEQVSADASGQVLLRTRLRACARRMGFGEVMREQMEIVCNEMATNQTKFASGKGLIQLWEVHTPRPALDLFAFDHGPGIADLERARRDGYSSAKTLGKGLGAIARLSHECEIYSIPRRDEEDGLPWHGTAVWARFYPSPPSAADGFQCGGYLRAFQDGPYNGDYLAARLDGAGLQWVHLDGLGHGREAAEAVAGAEGFSFEEHPHSPLSLLAHLDVRLRRGRGAVGLAGVLSASAGSSSSSTLRLCGVGEIGACVICNGVRETLSFPGGIVGQTHRRLAEHELVFPRQALLITFSDGLRRNWSLSSFPGLWRRHPQLIALVLGHVLGRGHDDCSVFAARATP
jgi:anti-sigma regulatory factor (Ser/Thr protein kinase)